MADIKLFNINGKVTELQSGNVTLEKELQTVIENNMETFFGVIELHRAELLAERIPHHAFAFVSMDFTTPDSPLQEIATDTAINGTAITVYELFKLGDKVSQSQIAISDILPMFTTNQLFAI